MFDNTDQIDLSKDASRSTMSTAAAWLGWILLLALAIVSGVHAISITQAYTGLNTSTGDAFAMIRVTGVILAELFAVVTAVLIATHAIRAKQKWAAMSVEVTWFLFAMLNLISSFAVEHGGDMPAFVGTWVRYGLPVAALIIGVQFYVMLRLNPDAKRADDDAEMREHFAHSLHQAKLEVLASQQMRAVLRQAQWQQLPSVIGRQLNLSDAQIRNLERQAPALLDLNQNGVPDIQEHQPTTTPPHPAAHGGITVPELQDLIDRGILYMPNHEPIPFNVAQPNGSHPNGLPAENGHSH